MGQGKSTAFPEDLLNKWKHYESCSSPHGTGSLHQAFLSIPTTSLGPQSSNSTAQWEDTLPSDPPELQLHIGTFLLLVMTPIRRVSPPGKQ